MVELSLENQFMPMKNWGLKPKKQVVLDAELFKEGVPIPNKVDHDFVHAFEK